MKYGRTSGVAIALSGRLRGRSEGRDALGEQNFCHNWPKWPASYQNRKETVAKDVILKTFFKTLYVFSLIFSFFIAPIYVSASTISTIQTKCTHKNMLRFTKAHIAFHIFPLPKVQ